MFVAGLFLLLAMTGCNTNPKVEEEINEFDSVEEIHFMFVEITQKKKNFFQKNNDKNNKKI